MGKLNTQFDITTAIIRSTPYQLGLDGRTKTVLIYISDGFFKDKTTGVFTSEVSQTQIAIHAGMGRNTVNKCVKTIEDLGIISSKQRHNTSKLYTWIGLPADKIKTETAKANREISTELRSKLKDISKLTQVDLLNIDRQIKAVDNCKGDRIFSIEDFTYLKLKEHFSYEIKGINKNIAKGVKDLLRQGVNINNDHEVQKLEDIEKCSGYVVYKASMTKRKKGVEVLTEPITEVIDQLRDRGECPEYIPEPTIEEQPDFEEIPLEYYNDHHQNNPLLWASCVEDFDKREELIDDIEYSG